MALRNLTHAMRKLTMHDEAVRSLQIAQLDAAHFGNYLNCARILAISKLRCVIYKLHKLAKRAEHI